MVRLKTALTAALALAALLLAPRPALAAEGLLCTTFPLYLFARDITENTDRFAPGLMTPGATGCPHDYAPAPAELEKLSQANFLVTNGLGLESYLPRALKVAKPALKIIDASGPGARPAPPQGEDGESAPEPGLFPTLAEAMAPPEGAANPHLFAAPGSALTQVRRVAEALAALDPEHGDTYRANAAGLAEDLGRIASAFYQAGVEAGRPKVVISHGSLAFLAEDMGLAVAATLEEEDGAAPTASRLAQLTKLIKEEKVRAILADAHEDMALARAMGAETKTPVAALDTAISGPPDAPREYYQGVMLTNLDVLKKLLAPPQAKAKARK